MIREQVRLNTEQFEVLKRKVGSNTIIDQNSTELVTAYKLGVQHVLNTLRDGWVVESPQPTPPRKSWVRNLIDKVKGYGGIL